MAMKLYSKTDDLVDVHLDICDLHVALILCDLIGRSSEATNRPKMNKNQLRQGCEAFITRPRLTL